MNDETEFEGAADDTVTCTRCGRRRLFPEGGKLLLHTEVEPVWIVDTRIQCGDGGLGCQETRVKIVIEFGFG